MAESPQSVIVKESVPARQFVIQKYDGDPPRFDLLLELNGVLKSWKIEEGPSFYPGDARSAHQEADHTLSFAKFEGDVPDQDHGLTHVQLWDKGYWQPEDNDPQDALQNGRLLFLLQGALMKGTWQLEKTAKTPGAPWILRKAADSFAMPSDAAKAFMEREGGLALTAAAILKRAHSFNPHLKRHNNPMEAPSPRFVPHSRAQEKNGEILLWPWTNHTDQEVMIFVLPETASRADRRTIDKIAVAAALARTFPKPPLLPVAPPAIPATVPATASPVPKSPEPVLPERLHWVIKDNRIYMFNEKGEDVSQRNLVEIARLTKLMTYSGILVGQVQASVPVEQTVSISATQFVPANRLVFTDVVYVNGHDYTNEPLEMRALQLAEIARNTGITLAPQIRDIVHAQSFTVEPAAISSLQGAGLPDENVPQPVADVVVQEASREPAPFPAEEIDYRAPARLADQNRRAAVASDAIGETQSLLEQFEQPASNGSVEAPATERIAEHPEAENFQPHIIEVQAEPTNDFESAVETLHNTGPGIAYEQSAFAGADITRADIVEYYEGAAPGLFPFLRDRDVVVISEKGLDVVRIQNEEDIVKLAQDGAVEFRPKEVSGNGDSELRIRLRAEGQETQVGMQEIAGALQKNLASQNVYTLPVSSGHGDIDLLVPVTSASSGVIRNILDRVAQTYSGPISVTVKTIDDTMPSLSPFSIRMKDNAPVPVFIDNLKEDTPRVTAYTALSRTQIGNQWIERYEDIRHKNAGITPEERVPIPTGE